jgi:superfamily II DNA or RNA helicase
MALTVSQHVEIESQKCLRAYRENPKLIAEAAGIEYGIIYGGYDRRQLFELVQNGADAMLESPGRIELIVTDTALYCANEGVPIDCDGVDVILSSNISNKRGAEIGRFGMGFKSVLGLTRNPSFFGSSGSFGFSQDLAEQHIRPISPDARTLPILRIAQVLDIAEEANDDPTLESLLRWATTVVRLPLTGNYDWLAAAIKEFPPEFLLFAPHVRSLTLHDRREEGGEKRVITVSRPAKNEIILGEQGREVRWKVFTVLLEPTKAAHEDAGDRVSRWKIPVNWAVPLERLAPRGSFWAFFPTKQQTTLSGILNAPWKTNEDRLHLLPGAFNMQIIQAAARLVVDSLPHLVNPDDPGIVLDVLPSQDPLDWADRELSENIFSLAKVNPVVPDQTGRLRIPQKIKLPPRDLPSKALAYWSTCPSRPATWSHISTERPLRRRRLERLISASQIATPQAWLEALIAKDSAASSIAALRCAELLEEADFEMNSVRAARIVMTTSGTFVPPVADHLFLPGDYDPRTDVVSVVHAEVAADEAAQTALYTLGIGAADAAGELRGLVDAGFNGYTDHEWSKLWKVAQTVGSTATNILRPSAFDTKLKVRTVDGTFHPIVETLLPGPIVPSGGADDQGVTIDVVFHAENLDLLRSLGCVASIVTDYPFVAGTLFGSYRRYAVEQFVARSKTKPQDLSRLMFDRRTCPGPLDVLDHLPEEAKAEFTHAALALPEAEWKLQHTTSKAYSPLSIDLGPTSWLLRRRGRVYTSFGVRPVTEAFSSRLGPFRDFVPVAELSQEDSDRLGLRTSLRPQDFQQALDAALSVNDEDALTALYLAAVRVVSCPPLIRCLVGDQFENHPPTDVTVVTSKTERGIFVKRLVPFLAASKTEAELMCKHWSLQMAAIAIRTEIIPGDPGLPTPIIDRFPFLAPFCSSEISLIACTSVEIREITEYGKQSETKPFFLDGNAGYYDETLDDNQLIAEIGRSLSPPLDDSQIKSFSGLFTSNHDEFPTSPEPDVLSRIATIRTLQSPAAKLVACLGPDAIRRKLPVGLTDAVQFQLKSERLSPNEIGEVALALYGTDVLRTYRQELEQAGFLPPTQWSGSHRARTFTRSLGFADKFAGLASPKREPLVDVRGPQHLPPLHPFQKHITDQMQSVVAGLGGFRAFISLPTGAGKTRVAVQGLIEAISAGKITRPILWVAQQDELCEQAVQTWRDAWQSLGTSSTLHISRLWGPNRVSYIDGLQVVVATIAKLEGVCRDDSYDWLRNPGALIVDEAHTSITKSYTQLLEWAGFGRDRGKDQSPLIGLSATPERGNEEESKRLVERYNARKLDSNAFKGDDPYLALQELGVLSRVQHETLEGAAIEPTPADLEHFRQYKKLTPDFEERIGRDHERNSKILASILNKPSSWTMIVFASSVQHAEILACLLTLSGVPSACITGQTEDGARADAIEKFRMGAIRVLTNYNVLTQGFDAPAVRALYVARPTFSANLYQQMIGRGLRGPLNGGKQECLIVNIEDNMIQYGTDLAFHSFAHLWSQSSAPLE